MGNFLKLGTRFLPLIACFTLSSVSFALSFYENSKGSPVLDIINSAKTSLDMEIYEMKDLKVQEAVKKAVDRGVKVRVVQEPSPVATSCFPFESVSAQDDQACSGIKKLVSYVKSKGGTYVPFSKALCGNPYSQYCVQHGKMIIADRKLALTSTGNFNPSNLCDLSEDPATCNRDYTLVDQDPAVVKTLTEVFEKDIVGSAYSIDTILKKNGTENQLTISPSHSAQPLINAIDAAKSLLIVENQYLKDLTMNDAIIRAAKRGVKVYVMVTTVCAFASNPSGIKQYEKDRWVNTYSAFDQAGVKTRVFSRNMKINGKAGYLHAKALIVDNKIAWIGSTNGSTNALVNNREFGTFTADSKVVKALYETFVSDIKHPESQTWKQSLQCLKDPPLPKPGSGNGNGDSDIN